MTTSIGSDALRGFKRVVSWGALPVVILTAQAQGSELPEWVAVVPILGLLLAGGVGALVGIARARRMRAIAAGLGWDGVEAPIFTADTPTDMFPFDDRRRNAGDATTGWWRGRPALIMQFGARTTVVAIETERALPPFQLVPRGVVGVLDAGAGNAVAFEDAALNAAWRVLAADPEFAHAALPPSSLALLGDQDVTRAIIAVHGRLAWTTDVGSRMLPDQARARLDVLSQLIDRVPEFVYGKYMASDHEVQPSTFFSGGRRRNSLGRLSILVAFTFLFAPLGVVLGALGLRAVARGDANNRRTCVVGILLSSAMTAFTAFAVLMAISGG